MKRFALFLSAVLILSGFFISCEKEPGEGGNSTIFGKVYVKNYDAYFINFYGEYYGPDEDVYIIYGEDKTYSDRVSTNYDGVYEFKYLRPGKYTVYTYSKDSTLQSPSGVYEVKQEVEITKKNQEVEVPDFVIFN